MNKETKNPRRGKRKPGDVEISPRQRATLDAIRDYWARYKIGPSRGDLARALGLRSASGTDRHIQALIHKRLVEAVPGASRALRVVDAGDVPLIKVNARVSHRKALVDEANRAGWIPECLTTRYSPRPDAFFAIPDESLAKVGVATGDLVAVREAQRAEPNELVVARVNGRVCWGRYARVDRQTVELVPPGRNRGAEARRIDLLDDEFQIEGIVIGTLTTRQLANED